MSKSAEFSRQELYDLVWATPMVKLAKEFGLSDIGLRKTCVRYQIPTPPLGYWAKLNFGKPVKKTPLLRPGPTRLRAALAADTHTPLARRKTSIFSVTNVACVTVQSCLAVAPQ
ncbi:hypothetical protein AB7Z32_02885 [Bradyrhizobium sp. 482_C4_N1_1]|uniref:hypothetical protein n=1 Tax=unclassified Bradyrhizobium TaxID=2631580 RepID=UPI003F8C65BE